LLFVALLFVALLGSDLILHTTNIREEMRGEERKSELEARKGS
jgi:hypothetical protein